jgi:hypothetical protein
MTVTADAKKRVVLPGAVPGDVFIYEETANGVLLKRICRRRESQKQTREQGRESSQTMGRPSKANPWAVSETSYLLLGYRLSVIAAGPTLLVIDNPTALRVDALCGIIPL